MLKAVDAALYRRSEVRGHCAPPGRCGSKRLEAARTYLFPEASWVEQALCNMYYDP